MHLFRVFALSIRSHTTGMLPHFKHKSIKKSVIINFGNQIKQLLIVVILTNLINFRERKKLNSDDMEKICTILGAAVSVAASGRLAADAPSNGPRLRYVISGWR